MKSSVFLAVFIIFVVNSVIICGCVRTTLYYKFQMIQLFLLETILVLRLTQFLLQKQQG